MLLMIMREKIENKAFIDEFLNYLYEELYKEIDTAITAGEEKIQRYWNNYVNLID